MTSKPTAPRSRSSRDRSRVSQQRAGLPQFQSRMSECQVRRAMIGAMREPSGYLPTGWSSGITDDTSAYRSSYTAVYTQGKEVS
jgi:hypothetical protein